MADTAEIPGGPGPPLISRPNGGPKGPPKIFEVRFALTPPPPSPNLSQDLDDWVHLLI